jgi:hypothetical protein
MLRRAWMLRLAVTIAGFAAAVPLGAAKPPVLDPAAIKIHLPDQIHWVDSPDGKSLAVLQGDPNKPGWYIALLKWHAHHNSRPHYHPNDRYITVLSGTWWVNTGSKYDPDHMIPLPVGTFVVHPAKTIHYDGAKDGDTVLEVVGQGPAPSIDAEDHNP